jgi:hypothetical protein
VSLAWSTTTRLPSAVIVAGAQNSPGPSVELFGRRHDVQRRPQGVGLGVGSRDVARRPIEDHNPDVRAVLDCRRELPASRTARSNGRGSSRTGTWPTVTRSRGRTSTSAPGPCVSALRVTCRSARTQPVARTLSTRSLRTSAPIVTPSGNGMRSIGLPTPQSVRTCCALVGGRSLAGGRAPPGGRALRGGGGRIGCSGQHALK